MHHLKKLLQASLKSIWNKPVEPEKLAPKIIDEPITSAPAYSGFQVSVLGTSSGSPTKVRNVTAIGLRHGGDHWLVDCGEAAQMAIRSCVTLNISRIDRIFITHLHGDHCWGLMGIVASVLIGGNAVPKLQIVGPPGVSDFILQALKNTYTLFSPKKLKIYELSTQRQASNANISSNNNGMVVAIFPDSNGVYQVHDGPGISIKAARIKHTVPCFGYVFEEKAKKASINEEYLTSLGVPPGPFYSTIKANLDKPTILLPNGKVVNTSDIIGYPKPARKIVVLGDTNDPSSIAPIAMNAHVLFHECTLPSGMESIAADRGHSTGTMAAKFAQQIKADNLILTHFSPRFQESEIANELTFLKKKFPNIPIFAAEDHDIVDLHVPSRKVIQDSPSSSKQVTLELTKTGSFVNPGLSLLKQRHDLTNGIFVEEEPGSSPELSQRDRMPPL